MEIVPVILVGLVLFTNVLRIYNNGSEIRRLDREIKVLNADLTQCVKNMNAYMKADTDTRHQ